MQQSLPAFSSQLVLRISILLRVASPSHSSFVDSFYPCWVFFSLAVVLYFFLLPPLPPFLVTAHPLVRSARVLLYSGASSFNGTFSQWSAHVLAFQLISWSWLDLAFSLSAEKIVLFSTQVCFYSPVPNCSKAATDGATSRPAAAFDWITDPWCVFFPALL